MGNLISLVFPPKSLFTVDQIPDLTGQIIIVTGGNTGIGKETCKALLNKNAKVYLAARSRSRAKDAIEWLKKETGGKTGIFLELDLADLGSIRKSVQEFKSHTSKEQELHVLFNNAGVLMPTIDQRASNGHEMHFATNVLGHYFLTMLLLPTLIHTAKFSTFAGGHARVINTSSASLYRPLGLYSQSKIGNVLFSNQLAKRYADQGIISVSVHPGFIKTEVSRNMNIPHWVQALVMLLFWEISVFPPSQGALTQLYAGTVPEVKPLNRKFLVPWARVADPGSLFRDEQLSERLWNWCEEQVQGV
ncbi:hypothetical protein FRC12_008954 [Ceratobasidium sp. 428]|nr:hypothetical protein FRC12_008954 [Ceratobasidium sp. 428]